MKDLLPCPFCGDDVTITYVSGDKAFCVWHKSGEKCGFIEPFWIDGENAKSLSDARAIWNKRKIPGYSDEQLF